MVIIINHKEAVLKKSTSFELITENYLFTGADSYTLSITLPIKDCPQNIEIFGHLYRKDCDISSTVFDCEIHEGNMHKYGAVVIVELDEVEVKIQFLEGRSKQNFHSSFDEVYINEIEMPSGQITAENLTPMDLMHSYTEQKEGTYYGFVVLPWVNNTSGNIQNKMRYVEGSSDIALEWEEENPTVVGFPYLLDIMERVFRGIGYDFDFSAIVNSKWKDCIVCNALPEPWNMPNMNYALPHWTVSEFIENLEKLLDGYLQVIESEKKVTFRFNDEVIDSQQTVLLEAVTDSLGLEIAEEDEEENSYIEMRGLAYQDGGHQMMKYYDCQWAVKQIGVIEWESYTEMRVALRPYLTPTSKKKFKYSHEYYRKIHYCKERDSYFILKLEHVSIDASDWEYHYELKITNVNEFAPYIPEGVDEGEMASVGMVPVCIDATDADHGDMMFLECGEFGDAEEEEGGYETNIVNKIIAGEKEKKTEFFNLMYVGFWNGVYTRFAGYMPRPEIYRYSTDGAAATGYSLKLTRGGGRGELRNKIVQARKYTFRFLADTIPDVTSKFIIQGKAYLAKKITSTISAENGMSRMMKMEAYRIEDD